MRWLEPLQRSYDRFLVASALVGAVVAIACASANPPKTGSWQLTALAAIPLSASLIAWGNRIPLAMLFAYGAVAAAISSSVLLSRIALTYDKQSNGLVALGSLICTLVVLVGVATSVMGAIVGATTIPKHSGRWERSRDRLLSSLGIPTPRTIAAFTPLVLAVLLFMISAAMTPYEQKVDLPSGGYVGIGRGYISFFSDAQGPYHGSIIALTDGNSPPKYDRSGFDFPGIYYRWFDFRLGTLWTLTFSLLFPIALAAIPAELWLVRRMTHRSEASAPRGAAQFQFRLRDAMHAMFWFCAASALLAAFSRSGYELRVDLYLAIISTGAAVGALIRRMPTALVVATTIVAPFVLLDLIAHWR